MHLGVANTGKAKVMKQQLKILNHHSSVMCSLIIDTELVSKTERSGDRKTFKLTYCSLHQC